MKMRMLPPRVFPAVAGVLLALACADGSGGAAGPARGGPQISGPGSAERAGAAAQESGPKTLGFEVLARYPHDVKAYTQGLLVVDGELYESTGQYGESTVRLVDLKTGNIRKSRALRANQFGEGLASVGGLLYQLTWKSGKALLYDRASLRPLSYGYSYPGEGWGLTTSPKGQLVMSDGTDVLRFLDPKGLVETRRLKVTDGGRPVRTLNELEWIDDEVWANIWQTNRIARIDPETGEVLAWVDLTGILGKYRVKSPSEDVLNGIALDPATGDIFVTGKRWPYLFKIRVK